MPGTHGTAMTMRYRGFWGLVVLVVTASGLGGVVARGRSAGGDGGALLGEDEVTWAFRSVGFRGNGGIAARAVHSHHEFYHWNTALITLLPEKEKHL